ncbi:MAG: SAM-dependent methyltransferase [Flammeovirgaceae bacterium]|nr:SAM-dependent methyltransferase [Flammeovirgaceae bacterium]HCX20498.1 class I SAM-dependent methyltransferase [Cytophagales bacterium]
MIEKKIYDTYEKLSTRYNELIDHKPHNAYYDRPNTLSLFPDKLEGMKVLDAACGPGKYAQELLRKGAKVTGFDQSPKMVQLAKERNGEQGDFFVHNLTEPLTSIGNESHNVVLCALALEYVEDWTLTIQEFNRVLKSEGVLIISITHPFFDYTFFESKNYFDTEEVKCTWTGFGEPIEMHSYRRSLSECITPLTSNGFQIDSILEPRPTEEMKQVAPRYYDELSKFPAFVCIRAQKRTMPIEH